MSRDKIDIGQDYGSLWQFCRSMDVALEVNYSAAEDNFEIRVISPALTECWYCKRCPDLSIALKWYRAHLEGVDYI